MTIQTALISRLAKLPPRTTTAEVTRDIRIPMRDGAMLQADLWRPADDDPARALVVIRTPYARTGLDIVGRLFAEHGHPVLVQNCRGTFGSTGTFVPFVNEANDGADTLTWVNTQPWADRPIALLGASYLGHTAYTLEQTNPSVIAAIALAVTSADFHTGVMYPHDTLASETALIWISGLLTQELPALSRFRAQRRIRGRMRAALLAAPDVADMALLKAKYAPYQDWVQHHTMDDPWWNSIDRRAVLPDLPPSVLVAGWFDPFLVGQLADHQTLTRNGRPVRLVVGPWTHGSPGIVGALTRETLHLLDDLHTTGGVAVHDGGTRTWVGLTQWPPATRTRTLFLTAGERLSDRVGESLDIRWTLDRTDPPPAAGGRGLNPAYAGRRRQTLRERRTDVLTITSGRLGLAITVAGAPSVQLRVASAVEPQEWFVRLCDVDRFGISRNVCDGYLRVPGSPAGMTERTVMIELASTAHTFRAGHRIRLQLAGSGYPFHPAPADGTPVRRILSRPDTPSSVSLPIVQGGWVAVAADLSRGVA